MKSKVNYKEMPNALKVEIRSNWKSIVGCGYLLIAFPLFIFLLVAIYLIKDDPGVIFRFDQRSFIFIGLMVISGYLLIVILRKIFQTEIARVENNQIVIGKKWLFKTDEVAFQRQDMKDFRYVGTESVTKHILATQGFDYLGFNTEERQIQHLVEDGKVAFFYHGRMFRFGKGLDADQGEEIIKRIKNWR